jgi:hypothetical protein
MKKTGRFSFNEGSESGIETLKKMIPYSLVLQLKAKANG